MARIAARSIPIALGSAVITLICLVVVSYWLRREMNQDIEPSIVDTTGIDDLKDTDDFTQIGSSLVLAPAEIVEMERLAKQGDGSAAYKLYMHYAIGLQDLEAAQPWLEKSAEHGYQSALLTLEARQQRRRSRESQD